MSLLNKLFKRNKEENEEIKTEKVEDAKNTAIKDMPMTEIPLKYEPTVFQKYPDGLPLIVLEYIDYSKFGAMLKQERLLPPSYDRKPIKVEIDGVFDKPRVILTFKSKTSDSERMFSIYGYSVASSAKSRDSITIMEVKHLMAEVWQKFAEKVMWAWERGYRYSLLDQDRKGNIPTSRYYVDETTLRKIRELEKIRGMSKNFMQEDMDYIQSIKQIAENNRKAMEAEEKDLL